MNAAFLLVTTAWFAAGQTPAAQPALVAAPGACGSACCSSCNDPCGNEGFGHRLRDTLKRLHNRNDCCQPCQAPCPAPKACPTTTCKVETCNTCNSGHGHALLRGHGHRNKGCDSCAAPTCTPTCAPTCNTCDSCDSGHKLLGRLKGLFQHRNNSCNTCDSCGSGAVAPSAEPINPPKTMPKGAAPAKEVRIDSPIQAPVPQAAPGLESAPAVVPSIDADSKNPY